MKVTNALAYRVVVKSFMVGASEGTEQLRLEKSESRGRAKLEFLFCENLKSKKLS
jgi:hypothetical protein